MTITNLKNALEVYRPSFPQGRPSVEGGHDHPSDLQGPNPLRSRGRPGHFVPVCGVLIPHRSEPVRCNAWRAPIGRPLSRMKEAGIHFVTRLNAAGHPTFTTVEGSLSPPAPREEVFLEGAPLQKGKRRRFREPPVIFRSFSAVETQS